MAGGFQQKESRGRGTGNGRHPLNEGKRWGCGIFRISAVAGRPNIEDPKQHEKRVQQKDQSQRQQKNHAKKSQKDGP